jgi:dipeptidyl aminopeptidase/acylaminoacyl peptidase
MAATELALQRLGAPRRKNFRRCPVAVGRMFHRALKENGVDTQMVIYPDEGHPIKQLPHREDVLTHVLDWFERHDKK